jgi:competence ComEA-like helix-hairpin-helix protein
MATKKVPNCTSCEAESYTRNHYFTGKLMVERDFTDEQRYFREKIRLHYQRLHGSGVVCGLQITAQQEPCDERYLNLSPGSAVDCCGQDILVAEPAVIDLYAFPAIQDLIAAIEDAGPGSETANATHVLQLCIQYRECPTEDIPVLYDECGCDDSRCAPNRILESYAIDLRMNPPPDPILTHQPDLNWLTTLNIAHAEQVFLHEASNRLYVLTTGDNGIIYQVSTDNFAIEVSFNLGRKGLALATNQAGTELFAVVANSGGMAAGNAELWVFDVTGTQLSAGTVRDGEISDSDNSLASATLLGDGRLLALFNSNGRLKLWDAAVADPSVMLQEAVIGVDLNGLSTGADGVTVYTAEPSSPTLRKLDTSASGFAPVTIAGWQAAGDTALKAVAVISSGLDLLAAIDDANDTFYLIDPAGTSSLLGQVALAHTPSDVVVSNGGHWAYVLVHDGDNAFIQSINVQSLRQGHQVVASLPEPAGDLSQALLITSTADRLFIPYLDDTTVDNVGGVAVMAIKEANCGDLLWPDDCPGCDTADCLVLATIENYRPGFRMLDMPSPLPDALADLAAGFARINNALGRKRLPSTQAIAEALQCLLENCCGGSSGGGEQGPPGPQGPQGPQGLPGADGLPGPPGADATLDGVEVEPVPCGEPPSGEVVVEGGETIIRLRIPTNCNPDLAHLCNINWFHNGVYTSSLLQSSGLVEIIEAENQIFFILRIRFDRPVRAEDLHGNSIRMTVSQLVTTAFISVELPLAVVPGVYQSPACSLGEFNNDARINGNYVNGALLRFNATVLASQSFRIGFRCRISIFGDFIRDQSGLAADLEHLPPWLSNQNPAEATAARTGDGVAGGEFHSWFSVSLYSGGVIAVPQAAVAESGTSLANNFNVTPDLINEFINRLSSAGRVNINTATVEELTTLNGIGPELAEAIIHARTYGRITGESVLLKISGIGKSLLAKIREQITFDDGE